MPLLKHSGFVSSIKSDDLTPWYTTLTDDETINFLKEGRTIRLNSLIIYADQEDIYVQMIPDDGILYVGAGTYRKYDDKDTISIKVLGASGQHIRWEGQSY